MFRALTPTRMPAGVNRFVSYGRSSDSSGLRAFPKRVFQWLADVTSPAGDGLTAAGTVADFHGIPF